MTGRGRKHKCVERGSIEEGQSDSKRTNMAAVEGETFPTEPPTTENHNKEPSLTDLREMLVDIQITVNNILLENLNTSNWPTSSPTPLMQRKYSRQGSSSTKI